MARKEKKYYFIYKTTNKITGRYYYGMHSTDNLDDGYLGSGKRLRYSINKYGEENHQREIIEFCPDQSFLKKRENELVNLNEIAKKDCMNLVVGGNGGLTGLSPDKIHLITSAGGRATARKLKIDSEYFKIHSLNSSIRMKELHREDKIKYDNFKNKKHSKKTKEKMSESSKGIGIGNKNSQYGTCWITKNNVNKKIKKEKLIDYIKVGWIKGRKY